MNRPSAARANGTRPRPASANKARIDTHPAGPLASRAHIDSVLGCHTALCELRDTVRPKYHAAIVALVERGYHREKRWQHRFDTRCVFIHRDDWRQLLGHDRERIDAVRDALFDARFSIPASHRAGTTIGYSLRASIRVALDRFDGVPLDPDASLIDTKNHATTPPPIATTPRKKPRGFRRSQAHDLLAPERCSIDRERLPDAAHAFAATAAANTGPGEWKLPPSPFDGLISQLYRDTEDRCQTRVTVFDDDSDADIDHRVRQLARETTAQRCQDIAGQAHRLAQVAPGGHMRLAFASSAAGRLYGRRVNGCNVQSMPRALRRIALAGLEEYDIAACAFTTALQLAEVGGLPCRYLSGYVTDKKLRRNQLANRCGRSVAAVKTALAAVAMGAIVPGYSEALASWHRAQAKGHNRTGYAVVDVLGLNAFAGISDELGSLADELTTIGALMIERAERSRCGGYLLNAKGLPIATDGKGKATRAQQLAHLYQGIEAVALTALLRTFDEVQLICHDAVFTRGPQDIVAGEAAMYEATGVPFALEVEVVGWGG